MLDIKCLRDPLYKRRDVASVTAHARSWHSRLTAEIVIPILQSDCNYTHVLNTFPVIMSYNVGYLPRLIENV